MKFAYILMGVVLVGGSANADVLSSCSEILQSYREFGFSGVALVKSRGQTICNGEMGFRDAGKLDPISSKDRLLIGSVTKQFAAASILLLAQRGSLIISDPLSKYFPQFPNSDEIQIHHLLSHTSGISEVVGTEKFNQLRWTPYRDLDPVIEEIKALPSEFPPGDHWSYSNSNYILLSKIVEKVSGQSWQDYVQNEILIPLNLSSTAFFLGKSAKLVSGHQFDRDYKFVENRMEEYYERGWANGAGGLESTVEDLARWNTTLFGGALLNPFFVSQMSSSQVTIDPKMSYGFGFFQRHDIANEKVVFHSGGIPGFSSMNIYLPDRDLSVVLLSNTFDGATTSKMAWSLLNMALGKSSEGPSLKEVSLANEQLKEKTGIYEFSELGFKISIRFENDALYASINGQSEYKLIPNSRFLFLHRAFALNFNFADDLQSVEIMLDGVPTRGKRIIE